MKLTLCAVLAPTLGALMSPQASGQETILIPFESPWEHLNQAADPAATDLDFSATWQGTAEGFTVPGAGVYDGPAFTAPAPALLSFGVIDFATTRTMLTDRITTYFRKKLTLASPATSIYATVLADDGAIIYIDGVEAKRVNMAVDAPGTHGTFNGALGATGTANNETVPAVVDLATLAAGDHVIAVGIYDASDTSSDLGFDLKLTSDTRVPLITSTLTLSGQASTPITNYTMTTTVGVPVLTRTAAPLPAGLNFDPATGVLSGTPTTAGVTDVILTATNSAGSDTQTLRITIADNPAVELHPLTGQWEWFFKTYDDGTAVIFQDNPNVAEPVPPVDDVVDADFDTTWFGRTNDFATPGNAYDGPAFSGPSPALLGFAAIDFGALATDLATAAPNAGEPAANNRFTGYFRARVNFPSAVNYLLTDLLADDGAVVYIDGVEVFRQNFGTPGAPADTFLEYTPGGANGPENATTRSIIPGTFTAGDHVVGVSVHQSSGTSSDLGFAMRLFTDSRAPAINSVLVSATSVGEPFTYAITVDPSRPASSFNATNLPPGLNVDTATGIISGTATAAGDFSITLSATNPNGTNTGTLALTVASGAIQLTADGLFTNFDLAASGATLHVRAPGSAELGFTQTGNRLFVTNAPRAGDNGVTGPKSAPNCIQVNNGSGINNAVRTETIAANGFTAVNAEVWCRTYSSSGTNFEVPDTVRVFIEASPDGATYAPAGDLIPLSVGNDDDSEDAITRLCLDDIRNGDWRLHTSGDVVLPAGTQFLRLVIEARNDSANEFQLFDDLKVRGGTGGGVLDADGDGQSDASEAFAGTNPNDPNSVLKITAVTGGGATASLTFTSVPGKSYLVEGSTVLDSGWTLLQDNIASAGFSTTVNLAGLPPGTKGFVRVRVKP